MPTYTVVLDGKIVDVGLLMGQAVDLIDTICSQVPDARVSYYEEAVSI